MKKKRDTFDVGNSARERDVEVVPKEKEEEPMLVEDEEAKQEARAADAQALQELNNKYLRLYAEFAAIRKGSTGKKRNSYGTAMNLFFMSYCRR